MSNGRSIPIQQIITENLGIQCIASESLALAFAGRNLDELKRVDIRQYYLDRVNGTGPFRDWPRRVSIRSAQSEITMLSALYAFLHDEGHAINNPCHRPRSLQKDSPLARGARPI